MEIIPESKTVKKFLRPLPERFRPKVTIIEESKSIDSMRFDDLYVRFRPMRCPYLMIRSLGKPYLRLLRMEDKILKL